MGGCRSQVERLRARPTGQGDAHRRSDVRREERQVRQLEADRRPGIATNRIGTKLIGSERIGELDRKPETFAEFALETLDQRTTASEQDAPHWQCARLGTEEFE